MVQHGATVKQQMVDVLGMKFGRRPKIFVVSVDVSNCVLLNDGCIPSFGWRYPSFGWPKVEAPVAGHCLCESQDLTQCDPTGQGGFGRGHEMLEFT